MIFYESYLKNDLFAIT